MTSAPVPGLSPAKRRRALALALVRASVTAAVLVAAYYVAPLDRLSDFPLWVTLSAALLALATVAGLQLRAIIRSRRPAIRAVESLAGTVPLFLLIFAAAYYVMQRADPLSFDTALSRTDSLYFTVTVFATVGFGDIVALSETARVLVTAQMILDLIVLGLGIRVFAGAVRYGRERAGTAPH